MRVGAHPITGHFGQNRCAAAARLLQLFEHQNSRAFAHDETVPLSIPGAGGPFGLVVTLRQRSHGREAADSHRRDTRLRAAADHRVGVAALNEPERIADRVGTGSAGGGGGRIRALCASANRNVTGSEIDNGRRDEKRRNASWTFLEQVAMFALDDLKTSNAAAD